MMKNCSGTQMQRLINKFVENDHEKVQFFITSCFFCLSLLWIQCHSCRWIVWLSFTSSIWKEYAWQTWRLRERSRSVLYASLESLIMKNYHLTYCFWFKDIKFFGGKLEEGMEEQWYLQRLESGLFTLQLIDYIILVVSHQGPSSVCLTHHSIHLYICSLIYTPFYCGFQAKQRILQILNMRGGSTKTIKSIMRGLFGVLVFSLGHPCILRDSPVMLGLISEYAGNIGDGDDPKQREDQEKILQLLEKFTAWCLSRIICYSSSLSLLSLYSSLRSSHKMIDY